MAEKRPIPTVCLNMIVKNEARVIGRLMENVVPIVDTYCICDTGSTDGTQQLIRDYFASKDIKGKIVEEPFRNFGHNRTSALRHAKGMADYILLLDADMVLVGAEAFDKKALTGEVYSLNQGSRVFSYSNVRMVRDDIEITCVGATHEYYDHKGSVSRLTGLHIDDIGDGGSKGDKFNRDLRLLREDLERDPGNGRTYFYLAQTYQNLGKLDDAMRCYKRRIKIGGWTEEVWYSYFSIGNIYERQGKAAEAVYAWLEAYSFYPRRAEPLYNIVRHYRIVGRHAAALLFYQIASAIPYPEHDVLFIHKDIYDYLLDYELSIIAYYLPQLPGDKRDIFMKLFNTKHSLDNNHIMSNYKFYVRQITELCALRTLDIAELIPEYPANAGYIASTPSIVTDASGYLLNIRHVNYRIDEDKGSYTYADGHNVMTNNSWARLDKDFQLVSCGIWENAHIERHRIRGLEDVKIHRHPSGKVTFVATAETRRAEDVGKQHLLMVYGDYDLSCNKLEYVDIQSPRGSPVEKNWALFNHNGQEKFVYQWYPLTLGRFEEGKAVIDHDTVEVPPFLRMLRGSSNGFRFEDELWFVCHVAEYSVPRHYYHCFVVLDADSLKYMRHSKLFKFDDAKIEFCLGLVVEEDRIIITHSNWDRTAKLKVFDRAALSEEVSI